MQSLAEDWHLSTATVASGFVLTTTFKLFIKCETGGQYVSILSLGKFEDNFLSEDAKQYNGNKIWYSLHIWSLAWRVIVIEYISNCLLVEGYVFTRGFIVLFFSFQTQMDIYKRFIKPSPFISLCILRDVLCFSSFAHFLCLKNALYYIGGNGGIVGGIVDREHKSN